MTGSPQRSRGTRCFVREIRANHDSGPRGRIDGTMALARRPGCLRPV